ncbi:MAG: phosphoribosylamine--glycine ligase [Acidobacteriota bacterium]
MRTLVIGGGGREHALAWKLKQSPQVTEVFVAPGNAGLDTLGSVVPIHHADIVEMADFAENVHVDLTVVGPELPLTLGIADEFHRRGLRIFGPTQAAAELEGSKVFAKRFLESEGIPTADFKVVSSHEKATAVADSGELGWPLVVKADGLAAGKGVIIAADREEAEAAFQVMFEEKSFGSASDQVVLERCLTGTEVSFHVLTDGEAFFPLASSQDYKRVGEGATGPNTGGMGTVSPSPLLSKELQQRILKEIVVPTLKGMKGQGRPYQGVLYIGLMITDEGPQVIEYNCRFGDPETQVLLPRLDGDLFELLNAVIDGKLSQVHPRWHHQAAVCVVMASEGYPGKPTTGRTIEGLDAAAQVPGVTVFHAATKSEDDVVKTTGGRVLGVTALSPNLPAARDHALEAVNAISFEGAHWRRDIGQDVIDFLEKS